MSSLQPAQSKSTSTPATFSTTESSSGVSPLSGHAFCTYCLVRTRWWFARALYLDGARWNCRAQSWQQKYTLPCLYGTKAFLLVTDFLSMRHLIPRSNFSGLRSAPVAITSNKTDVKKVILRPRCMVPAPKHGREGEKCSRYIPVWWPLAGIHATANMRKPREVYLLHEREMA